MLVTCVRVGQVAMGQLDACFHEASLGVQSMAPTLTSPVNGEDGSEDGSPKRSVVRTGKRGTMYARISSFCDVRSVQEFAG